MTASIGFPRLAAGPAGADQSAEVITLADAQNQILVGGPVSYVSIGPWKDLAYKTRSQFAQVIIEWTASGPMTIGDGTIAIALFGEITGVGKTLLGILGLNLGNASPQIPIVGATIGFSQPVCNVALYDKLGIGTIGSAITLDSGSYTVKARPVYQNAYPG